jgi:ribosome-binding protein aMBF1 (putative translation factor)
MSTNLNKQDTRTFFGELFETRSKEEIVLSKAMMIHYKVMQLVEKAMDKKGWNKMILSERLGVSQSYLTQLFLGNKIVNLQMLANLQDTLEIKFIFETEYKDETYYSWRLKKMPPSKNEDVEQEKLTKIYFSSKALALVPKAS